LGEKKKAKKTTHVLKNRPGMVYSAIYLRTYALPCFNELLLTFYPLGNKIVPLNIAELLTPLGLAYWICDDGSFFFFPKFFCGTQKNYALLTQSVATVFIPPTEE
jgi:hypothetical protein